MLKSLLKLTAFCLLCFPLVLFFQNCDGQFNAKTSFSSTATDTFLQIDDDYAVRMPTGGSEENHVNIRYISEALENCGVHSHGQTWSVRHEAVNAPDPKCPDSDQRRLSIEKERLFYCNHGETESIGESARILDAIGLCPGAKDNETPSDCSGLAHGSTRWEAVGDPQQMTPECDGSQDHVMVMITQEHKEVLCNDGKIEMTGKTKETGTSKKLACSNVGCGDLAHGQTVQQDAGTKVTTVPCPSNSRGEISNTHRMIETLMCNNGTLELVNTSKGELLSVNNNCIPQERMCGSLANGETKTEVNGTLKQKQPCQDGFSGDITLTYEKVVTKTCHSGGRLTTENSKGRLLSTQKKCVPISEPDRCEGHLVNGHCIPYQERTCRSHHAYISTLRSRALSDVGSKIFFVYCHFLDRTPDSTGFNFWVNMIQQQGGGDRLAASMMASALAWEECSMRASGHSSSGANSCLDDTATIVDNAFRVIYQRTPDASGRAFWINDLESQSFRNNYEKIHYIADKFVRGSEFGYKDVF